MTAYGVGTRGRGIGREVEDIELPKAEIAFGPAILKGIAFRSADRPLGEALTKKGRPIHLAGRLLANDWQGTRRIELSIEDAALV